MEFEKTTLPGLYLVRSEVARDARGGFVRTFCHETFRKAGLNFNPTQCSESINNRKGTLRGMHLQRAPGEEQKLVRCTRGQIFDVAVDVRSGSPSFGRWFSVTLSEDDNLALYIPKGFAHGFQTLEDHSTVAYSISPDFVAELTAGFHWADPTIGINWPLSVPLVISERDEGLPILKDMNAS
jgi:dTDP-4-dehydrorhamnose 3,5-epimerase